MCISPLHRPIGAEPETRAEVWGTIMYYLEQVIEGAWVKAVATTVTAFFLDFLHGDLHVLYIYLTFSFADLYFGRKLSKQLGLYDIRKMKFWARKQLTHFTIVIMIGLLGHATFLTSKGYDISLMNWAILFLTYVEAASVEDKLKMLGWPIHPVIHKIFSMMRKKTVHNFAAMLDDPEMREELEKAMRLRNCEIVEERR